MRWVGGVKVSKATNAKTVVDLIDKRPNMVGLVAIQDPVAENLTGRSWEISDRWFHISTGTHSIWFDHMDFCRLSHIIAITNGVEGDIRFVGRDPCAWGWGFRVSF